MNREKRGRKKETKERGNGIQPRAGLARTPLPLVRCHRIPPGARCHYTSDHSVPQELQDLLCRPHVPQQSERGGSWAFPPVCLPYVLPQFSNLGGSCRTFKEDMVSRLRLAAAAPPALIPVGLCLFVKVGPY